MTGRSPPSVEAIRTAANPRITSTRPDEHDADHESEEEFFHT